MWNCSVKRCSRFMVSDVLIFRFDSYDIRMWKSKNNLEAVKKRWLPQVIMADDFDAAWDQYMEEYNACNPQIYFDYLQQKVNEN